MPRNIQDFATRDRQLWLQSLQPGRSLDTPEGLTVTRQSDFESSSVWRAVIVATLVVIGFSLFAPAPSAATSVAQSVAA